MLMARSIADIVEDIRSAIYGRDVRSAIADGIETCYSDITNSETIASSAASNANSAATRAEYAAEAAENVVDIYRSEKQQGTDLKTVIEGLRDETLGYKNSAGSSATSASTSASAASTSATNAANSASAAGTSATNAANSASTAGTAATTATDAATRAATSATSAAGSESAARTYAEASAEAEGYRDQAWTYATTASASAESASLSAESALSSKNAAKISEDNAKDSEDNAKDSEDNAKASEISALASKNAAKTSEDNAKTSEDNAKTSEDNALLSENAAKTSEDNAKASEIATLASQNAAKTSEDNAKDSEDNAKDSELAAKSYEASASTSATTALEVYNYIEDHYPNIISSATSASADATRAEAAADRAENATQGLDEAIANSVAATNAANSAASVATEATTSYVTMQNSLTVLRDSLENTYIPNITNATTRANTATTNANNAASNANSLITEAESLVTSMESSVSEWMERRSTIDSLIIENQEVIEGTRAATQAIEDMTVTSETVSVGQASAEISDVDGHKNIHFVLRKGDPGTSYIVKGHAFDTYEDLEETITDPAEGDLYNVGTSAPYTVYRWTGEEWESQGNIGFTVKALTDEEINDLYSQIQITDPTNKFLSANGVSYYTHNKILPAINQKVDKVTGKGLSTNDFTDNYKNQIDTNKTSITVLSSNKVDKVSGKGLSTNDFTTSYKNQIDTNKNDITSLTTSKLNSDFSEFSAITAGTMGNALIPIRLNSTVYKISGSQLISDIIELGSMLTRYDVASVAETTEYLGITST